MARGLAEYISSSSGSGPPNVFWCILGINLHLFDCLNDGIISRVYSLNTKWYVPKAFLSPFVDGMVMAQIMASPEADIQTK